MSQASRRSSRTGLLLLAVLLLFALLLIGVVAWGYLQSQRITPVPIPPAKPAATAPYQVFFTDPSFPEQAGNRHGSLDDRLTDFLRTATASIDVAIYDFDLDNVAQALIDAHKRGVRVRLVIDTDNIEHEPIQRLRAAGIPIVDDQRSAIMHHKFAIVDQEAVWMGSWNFTVFDTYRYNNNAVLWHSEELAANYTATFDKMFGGEFGPTKPEGIPHPTVAIDDVQVQSFFAAETDPTSAVIERLRNAQRSITIMAFSFTHDRMGEAIRTRGQQGVQVRGVFERTGSQTRFSEFGQFKEAGFDVVQDGNPYLMHHKVIVIDEQTVIVGSFNFSSNAAESNDENLLIVDDPAMARLYLDEFEKVYAQALNPPERR